MMLIANKLNQKKLNVARFVEAFLHIFFAFDIVTMLYLFINPSKKIHMK